MRTAKRSEIKDGLVGILKDKSDLTILQTQGWYRIPVASAPRHWPPRWLAFYQPQNFGADAYRIRYYGQVKAIRRVKRQQIFPNEIPSALSEKEYFILELDRLEELATPIPSFRPRRLVFIPTTWKKFETAEQINDLFDDSPLEDLLWSELKRIPLSAERQWAVMLNQSIRYLDFALFCNHGAINVETDGDRWHLDRKRAPLDNARDNALQIEGWTVLRYSTGQIRERMQSECIPGIEASINQLGGLASDGLVPRIFYNSGASSAQQLNLLDRDGRHYFAEAFARDGEESD